MSRIFSKWSGEYIVGDLEGVLRVPFGVADGEVKPLVVAVGV